jgi:hypothetical protein
MQLRKKSELGRVKLIYKFFSEVTPADYNPRTMSDKAREGLSNSISTFGLVQPIIYNKRTGNIVGGHQRMTDLIAKGVEGTDMVEVDLPDSYEKALNITLNHPGIEGEFDNEKLQPLLSEVPKELMSELNLDELEINLKNTPELHLDENLSYKIIVECANEIEQTDLLNELEKRDYKCQLLIS